MPSLMLGVNDASRSPNGCLINEQYKKMPRMRAPTREVVGNSQAAVSTMIKNALVKHELCAPHPGVFNHFASWKFQMHGFGIFRDIQ